MAVDVEWAQFIGLLDIDGARSDTNGALARALKRTMEDYMVARFATAEVTYLVDIVKSPAVIGSIVTNLQNIATDDAAIKAAVDSVVVPAP